jgi:hypothetical protein
MGHRGHRRCVARICSREKQFEAREVTAVPLARTATGDRGEPTCIRLTAAAVLRLRSLKASGWKACMLMIGSVFVVLSVVLVGAAVLAYDDLILFERDRFPDEWTHDGMPTTLIRRSGRRGGITSTYAAASSCLRWTLFTPSWIRTDRQAAMLIRRIQILLIVWTFVLVPGLVFAFVSVMRDAK